jgi:hypothetical protein
LIGMQATKNPDVLNTEAKTFMGYSNFPKEVLPVPKEFMQTVGNLVYYSQKQKVRYTSQPFEYWCTKTPFRVDISLR